MTGCTPILTTSISTTNPKTYKPPELKAIYFEQGKEATWIKLLDLSYSSSFHVEMINMDAFQIKLRKEGNPEKFVDCGTKKIVTVGKTELEYHGSIFDPTVVSKDEVTNVTNSASYYTYQAYRDRADCENNFD